ncbi:MAG: low molecular weight protein-tyrosine-phosphatase, partial [Nocardioidaceae bacterium]
VVLGARLDEAGLSGRVEVDSCGIGGWHAGERMDDRAAATLSAHDYDPTSHRARQLTAAWFADHDLLLAMDHDNDRQARALAPSSADADRVRMFRSFDPEASEADDQVPDPWYGSPEGFERVLATIERTTKAIVAALDEST